MQTERFALPFNCFFVFFCAQLLFIATLLHFAWERINLHKRSESDWRPSESPNKLSPSISSHFCGKFSPSAAAAAAMLSAARRRTITCFSSRRQLVVVVVLSKTIFVSLIHLTRSLARRVRQQDCSQIVHYLAPMEASLTVTSTAATAKPLS